jgi:hypothetical protein
MTKKCAIISGNTVTNVVIVDDIEQASNDLGVTLIEYTAENPAGIGWTYDGTTFTAPASKE